MIKKNIYIEVIQQLSEVLNQLNTEKYSEKLPILNGSSIGQHVRHVVEFYLCLLKGVKHGVVDYDARERNVRLETDLDFAQNTLFSILEDINSIKNPAESLLLAICFDENEPEYIETNFLRELIYMIEHSIHHYALIRIGLQENFPSVNISPNFGIAYSTIKHHEAVSA